MLCKASNVDSFDDAVARVASQVTGKLVDGLLRVHVESVTLFKCRKPSTSIVPVPISHLEMQCFNKYNLLGSAVALLITELLASIGCEKALTVGRV